MIYMKNAISPLRYGTVRTVLKVLMRTSTSTEKCIAVVGAFGLVTVLSRVVSISRRSRTYSTSPGTSTLVVATQRHTSTPTVSIVPVGHRKAPHEHCTGSTVVFSREAQSYLLFFGCMACDCDTTISIDEQRILTPPVKQLRTVS